MPDNVLPTNIDFSKIYSQRNKLIALPPPPDSWNKFSGTNPTQPSTFCKLRGEIDTRISNAEAFIIRHESMGNTRARPKECPMGFDITTGKKCTAFGIGQLTEANRIKYGMQLGIDPNTTDYNEQLALMRAYIADRYTNADRAMIHWIAYRSY